MADTKTLGGSLEVRYIPDGYTDQEKEQGASWPLGAGTIVVGIPVGDGFAVLGRFKAGAFYDEAGLAELQRQAATPDETPAAEPASGDTPQ